MGRAQALTKKNRAWLKKAHGQLTITKEIKPPQLNYRSVFIYLLNATGTIPARY